MREIEDWFELVNADNSKGNDHKFVCIPKYDKFRPTFRLIEKSPLEIFPAYGGGVLVLYWCGALEISDNDAIQRIKILF